MKNILNQIKQSASNTADIYIYGDIYDSWWSDESNSAICLKDKLLELGDISEINLHINSLGGDVFEGLAMFNLLKQHKANVKVYIDGIAASIASVIAMAGDTVYMPKNAYMMIHNCWTCMQGNSKELRKTADDLDKIMEGSIESYLSKVKISREKLVELLDAESYLTAEECYEMGFADVVMPISETIEQSATRSILQLVKENKELKMQINSTKNETINVSKEAIEEIANEVVKKLENNTDKLLNEFLKGSQKEEPVGLYNQKEDSKLNIFESFFNGIFKNEREEK